MYFTKYFITMKCMTILDPKQHFFLSSNHFIVSLRGMAIIKTLQATFPFLYRPVKETDSC